MFTRLLASDIHTKVTYVGVSQEEREVRIFGRPLRKKREKNPITKDERLMIARCLRDGDIALDVGAHHGKWSEAVLANCKAEIHAFEASSEAYSVLTDAFSDNLTLNWNAVTNRNADQVFTVYRDDARLSSLHRRRSVENSLLPLGYDEITVPGITLDTYWMHRQDQIRFLKMDVEGAEYDALRGAVGLLRRGQIDFLQFEYGGTFLDAGTTLRNVWALLRRYGYRVLKVNKGRFSELKAFAPSQEHYQYSNYLAVHERLAPVFLKEKVGISLEFERMLEYGIRPSGVLHVGAHQGNEISTYRKNGIKKVVFIEANPNLASRLRDRFTDQADVKVIEAAASETEGRATFNITSFDQSSSLLPLKEHARLYPKIKVDHSVEVRTARLDDLLAEAGVDFQAIDFIAMDIQGAELMALRGATSCLENVKALQIEINYKQLYEGCALIFEIDEFLAKHDFIRVHTQTPYSETWGDALYVRRPMVGCTSLGKMGRFANSLFQYMFIHTYARDMDYTPVHEMWSGDDIFNVIPGTVSPPILPNKFEESGYEFKDSSITGDPKPRPACDFSGFFQYQTRYYLPHQEMIRDHLSFKGKYAERCDQIRALFDAQPGPVITVHLRRGDFGTGIFFIAPEGWYLDWLSTLREEHPELSVYIASDDLNAVKSAFSDYPLLTEADLPKSELAHDFATDFIALTQGDTIAISNSSFSFAASMLNTRAKLFVRPVLERERLESFDPWNSPVLLRSIEAEDIGDHVMSKKAMTRSKYKIAKLKKIFKW